MTDADLPYATTGDDGEHIGYLWLEKPLRGGKRYWFAVHPPHSDVPIVEDSRESLRLAEKKMREELLKVQRNQEATT